MLDRNENGHEIRWLSPVGLVGIRLEEGAVAALDFLPHGTEKLPESALATQVIQVLQAYFTHAHAPCDLPLAPQGTPFQRRVWAALRTISVGQVLTYGLLAQQLGTSARAVGGACAANPLPIIVPCHRVVATTGLGGYSGAGGFPRLDIKRWLLHHEDWRSGKPHSCARS